MLKIGFLKKISLRMFPKKGIDTKSSIVLGWVKNKTNQKMEFLYEKNL